MKLRDDHKRYLAIAFILGFIPTGWAFVNSDEYFKAGLIYIVFFLVLALFYVVPSSNIFGK